MFKISFYPWYVFENYWLILQPHLPCHNGLRIGCQKRTDNRSVSHKWAQSLVYPANTSDAAMALSSHRNVLAHLLRYYYVKYSLATELSTHIPPRAVVSWGYNMISPLIFNDVSSFISLTSYRYRNWRPFETCVHRHAMRQAGRQAITNDGFKLPETPFANMD